MRPALGEMIGVGLTADGADTVDIGVSGGRGEVGVIGLAADCAGVAAAAARFAGGGDEDGGEIAGVVARRARRDADGDRGVDHALGRRVGAVFGDDERRFLLWGDGDLDLPVARIAAGDGVDAVFIDLQRVEAGQNEDGMAAVAARRVKQNAVGGGQVDLGDDLAHALTSFSEETICFMQSSLCDDIEFPVYIRI